MLNKAILMGRLVADPELRRTQSGVAVVSFRIAVDRNYKSADESQQSADFIDVVAWRGTAEFVSKWFSKGKMIVVVGSIQSRNWTDKDGNKRYSVEVVAEEVQFGESKKNDSAGAGGGVPQPEYNQSKSEYKPSSGSDFTELSDDDDELPF